MKKDANLEPLLNKESFSTYLYNLLFYNKADSVQHVMVDGKWIMKDRKLTMIDEEEVVKRYSKIAEGFLDYLKD